MGHRSYMEKLQNVLYDNQNSMNNVKFRSQRQSQNILNTYSRIYFEGFSKLLIKAFPQAFLKNSNCIGFELLESNIYWDGF